MIPTKVSRGRSIQWIKSGFSMIFDEPGVWIGGFTTLIVLFIVLGFIPWVGGIIVQLVQFCAFPLALAFADAQRHGRKFYFDAYFKPLSPTLSKLVGLGLLNLLLIIVAAVPLLAATYTLGGFESLTGKAPNPATWQSFAYLILGVGCSALLIVATQAASCYAAPLILFHGLSIPEAMKASWRGSIQNVLPIFVHLLLIMLIFFLGMIPLFLGLMVIFPLLITSYYQSYAEIFEAEKSKSLE